MFKISQWVRNKKDGATGYVDIVNLTHEPVYKIYYVQDKYGNQLKGNPWVWTYGKHLEALPTHVIYAPAAIESLIDLTLATRDFAWYKQLTKFNAIEA